MVKFKTETITSPSRLRALCSALYCAFVMPTEQHLCTINYNVAWFCTVALSFINKKLSYPRETTLQGGLVLARSGRLELGDNILRTLYICLQPF